MPWYRTPDGVVCHINFGGKNKKAPHACGAPRAWPDGGKICLLFAHILCDWKTESGTCDRPLCASHAFQVDEDKHLCPEHVELYRAWLRSEGIAYG